MGCGKLPAKITLVIGNSFFLVLGGALIGLGAWIRYKSDDYDTVLGSNGVQTPATLIMAAGVAVFLVAFLGFCGACKENKCCLLLYMIFVGIILLLEIACVAVAFVFRGKVKNSVEDAVTKAIQKTYGMKGHDAITAAIDDIQEQMKCCGARGVNDFQMSSWVKNHQNNQTAFPQSCIDDRKKNYTMNATNSGDLPFDKGCIEKMEEWGKENLIILGGLAAAVLFIELGSFICAIIVYKKKYQEVDVV